MKIHWQLNVQNVSKDGPTKIRHCPIYHYQNLYSLPPIEKWTDKIQNFVHVVRALQTPTKLTLYRRQKTKNQTPVRSQKWILALPSKVEPKWYIDTISEKMDRFFTAWKTNIAV